MPLDSLYASLEKPRTPRGLPPSLQAQRTARPLTARNSRPTTPRSQPELLQSLMHFVRAELAPLGDDERSSSPDNPQLLLERLDVFRRAFAHFIAAFGSYAPLLLAIQTAYEDVVRQLGGAGDGAAELRRRLSTSQQETAQLLLEQRREHGRAVASLQEAVRQRDMGAQELERTVRKQDLELSTLRRELNEAKKSVEDADARKFDFERQIDHWQAQATEALKEGDHLKKEVMKLRARVRQSEERERAQLQEENEVRQQLHEAQTEVKAAKETMVPRQLLATSQEQLKAAKGAQLKAKDRADELEHLLAGGEPAARFPDGLDWAGDAVDGVPYLDPAWAGCRASDIVALVVGDLVAFHGVVSADAADAAAAIAGGAVGGAPESPARGADAEAAPAAAPTVGAAAVVARDRFVQGETSAARAAAGSAFGGLVRIREGDWGREVTVGWMRQLWVHRKKLSDKGTVTPLNQVFAQLAAQSHVGERSRRAHAGLVCAAAYNFEAALRRLGAEEPQMLLFLFAFQGALPPEVFTELHREANVVHRSLSAIAIEGAGGDEMLPMATVEERLPSVMPTKSEGARAEILAALRADASDGFVPLAAVASSGAEPSEAAARGYRLVFQRQFVDELLQMRDDIAAALAREIVGRGDSAALVVPPAAARVCLQRVDAALPSPVLSGLLRRVYGSAVADGADIDPAELPTLDEFLQRLYRGALKRYSPRADDELCAAIEEHVLDAMAEAKKGKGKEKGKAKKAKGGAAGKEAAGVTVAVAHHAILAADGGRSDGEAEWLAATVVHAALAEARAAGLAADVDVPYEFFTRHLRGALVQAS